MDVSKLPKLSQSPPPPPTPSDSDPPPAAPMAHPADQQPVTRAVQFADVWIGIGIGAILLVMSPRFLQWAVAKIGMGQFTWTFTNPDGSPLAYEDSVFFLGDIAVTAFAAVLILDGILAAVRRPVLGLRVAIALTVLTVLLNLYYVATMFSQYGPQLFSLLAFVFGIYLLTLQLSHLKLAQAVRRSTRT
jgi:hypothetical protein